MARNNKGSHRIVVSDVEYRWRATGNDGWISVNIWPVTKPGSVINTMLGYHEAFDAISDSHWISQGNQVIVTNRIVRRIVELAITGYGYSPHNDGKQVTIRNLESQIEWSDAVRARTDG